MRTWRQRAIGWITLNQLWTRATLAFCIAFGLTLIVSVQLAAEGSWYWYAYLVRGGTRLYSDLHFSLQPLFVLEAALFQTILGTSWLASKVPALLHLAAFAVGMYLLAMKSRWQDRQKAVLLFCAFFLGIHFEAYRFDDYHAIADSFYMYTVLLLLKLERELSMRMQGLIISLLGLFSGLSVVLRLNDGLALASFTALAIVCMATLRRWSSLLLFVVVATTTAAIIIALTGDSLVTWATYSVLHVGAIKGGTAQFLTDPINIFTSAYTYVSSTGKSTILTMLTFALSWSLLINSFKRQQLRASLAKVAFGIFIAAYSLYFLAAEIRDGRVVVATHAMCTCIALIATLFVIGRAANLLGSKSPIWRPREIIIFVPVIMLASGSLSSAGSFVDLFIASAFLILLFPIVWPYPKPDWVRSTVITVLALTGVSGAIYRYNDPASWISYTTFPLFANRTLVDHPSFGPMVIDNRLLQFITPICAMVNDGEPKRELLSIPWAFANYYCNVPPWHGFVQTWFDTSSKPYIDSLIAQLELSPPKWILYQRQIDTLSIHEMLYNQGLPLPQRALDQAIMDKINSGEWRIVRQEAYGADSNWILLRTRWAVSHGANLLSNPTGARGLAYWQVLYTAPTWSADARHGGRLIAFHAGTTAGQSTFAHNVSFSEDGPVSVHVRVEAVNVGPGNPGYTVDLYDATTSNVVSSLGTTDFDGPPRDFGFVANVSHNHAYQLRLQYNTSGVVYFSNISIKSARGLMRLKARSQQLSTSTLDGWYSLQSAPVWSSDPTDGGRFVVTHQAATPAESTLYHKLSFPRPDVCTIQVNIASDYLDPAGGYGYVVDLYDVTNNVIVGSLGVPAIASPMRHYAFRAAVVPQDTYQLRLRFNAGRSKIVFSRIKVEEGPIATSWSDEATARAGAKALITK